LSLDLQSLMKRTLALTACLDLQPLLHCPQLSAVAQMRLKSRACCTNINPNQQRLGLMIGQALREMKQLEPYAEWCAPQEGDEAKETFRQIFVYLAECPADSRGPHRVGFAVNDSEVCVVLSRPAS
jgi:hypothetical protein